jgi:hypothetical protein
MCPYLDRRDDRCAELLTLTNLREAFRLCAGNHEFCTLYYEIRLDDRREHRAELLAARSA